MSVELGQVIDGKYRIVRLIGEGGMGAVYEGENVRIKRKVAIKLLHAGVAANEEMVRRFEREAQVAGTVGNDHILEILDLGALPDGDRYMVMEYLEGDTLTGRIQARTRLPEREASFLIKQVLIGLGAAHTAGIVHRDLKPDNIFILKEKAGQKDYVKIIDFGISKFTEQANTAKMTRTGTLMGTPHYMAPEQATGSSEIDRRTDLYAIGIILYESLTGRVPFQAETFNQLLFEIALAKLIPARSVVPDLDPAMDSIVMKASAREPGHRFQTAEEFVRALDEWEQSGRSVSLPPEQSLESIVATAVPRAAPTPSAGGTVASASVVQRMSAVPGGSVPGVPTGSVQAIPVGSVPGASVAGVPQGPTVNTWAAQPALPAPAKSNAPIAIATAVALLVGGSIAAFLIFGGDADEAAATAPSAAPPVPAAPVVVAPPVVSPPAPVPVVSAAPAPVVAPAVSVSAAPAVRPVAGPLPKAPGVKPVPVAADKPGSTPPPPKKKPGFNFGY